MLAANLHDDLIRLGSVRCRGGRDAIRERLRLEAAMASLTASSCGLPGQALLFVRRLAPGVPLRPGFADTVRSELISTLQHARRPWLQSDGAAEAVLFLDEAELAACLVRDWLRGRVADAWWWRTLLGAGSVNDWLRRHVYARGDVFAAATERSTEFHGAAAWYARIDLAEAARAQAALSFAYGVSTGDERPIEPPSAARANGRAEHADRRGRQSRDALDDEVATLWETAPEIASCNLDVVQHRLLATSLAIRRRLQWARSASFARALHALETRREAMLHTAARHKSRSPQSESPSRRSARGPDASRVPVNLRVPVERAMTARAADPVKPPRQARAIPAPAVASPGPRTNAQSASESERAASTQRARASRRPAVISVAQPAVRSASAAASLAMPLLDEPKEGVGAAIEIPAAVTRRPELPLLTRATQTRFGGIFYLLNVALALGLYCDFTAPRGPNLGLSPWDFLSAAGSRWFGAAFRRDALWKVLAGLAGHAPRMRPERAVMPPRELARLLGSMQERLVLALGTCDSKAVRDRVCRHDAHIYMSAAALDVHLSLSGLPIEIRCAGLDRDPGWIPAAGRSVRFHFA